MEPSRIMKRRGDGRLGTFVRVLVQIAFATSFLARTFAAEAYGNVTSKRVVYYYQTQFTDDGDTGTFNSLLPLIAKENLNAEGKPFTTDVLVGAFHLGAQTDGSHMHLNNFRANDSRFDILWNETEKIQSQGINVNMFLGGYDDQSYLNLAFNFDFYYPVLKETIQTYKFNGIDLDVEDHIETTKQIEKVIHQLRADFGPGFVITLAPVASDLAFGLGLSRINYPTLLKDEGSNISWFNVQFYSGFGTLSSPSSYQQIINSSFPANLIVAAMIANPTVGRGFVDIATVNQTVKSLVKEFPNFGGVAAWEYFNALPGGSPQPAKWGTYFGSLMAGG